MTMVTSIRLAAVLTLLALFPVSVPIQAAAQDPAGQRAYFASGYGGQLNNVVPEFDLAVVTGMTPIQVNEADRQ